MRLEIKRLRDCEISDYSLIPNRTISNLLISQSPISYSHQFMKYYIYKSKLIVPLVKELEVECSIKTIEVKGRQFERLAADFAFNQLPAEEAVHKLPISRQQALYHYLRLREQEFLYRNSCELWWKPRKMAFSRTKPSSCPMLCCLW